MSKPEPIVLGGGTRENRHAVLKPDLGTGLVSYEHSISPRSYELEREAVFRRCWLNVGHEAQLRQSGCYFTRELEVLDTSLIIVRGKDDKLRAFHNVCPHRGNKLVWEGHPGKELAGRRAAFFCKYHGLGFGLDGSLVVLPDPEDWHGDQGCSLRLAEVPLELWNGFIFVNLTPGGPTQTLAEFLGAYMTGALDDFPMELYTERFVARAEIQSNWKTLHDAFSEAWHGGTLHRQSMSGLRGTLFRAPFMRFEDPHRVTSTSGWYSEENYSFTLEKLSFGTVGGPQAPLPHPIAPPRSAVPEGMENWLHTTFTLFPNFQVQLYAPGMIMTYNYWPLAHDRMRFEVTQYHQQSRNFSDLFARKASFSFVYDAMLQDLGTLEATQRGLQSRAFDRYPLIDEEIGIRHLHAMIDRRIKAHENTLAEGDGTALSERR